MTVGVYGDGLIARIGTQDMDAATAQPGVRPFDMTGRPMRGVVVIDSAVLDDKALDRWIGQPAGTWQACRRSSPVPLHPRHVAAGVTAPSVLCQAVGVT